MPLEADAGAFVARIPMIFARMTGRLNEAISPTIADFDSSNSLFRILVQVDAHPGLTPSALADRLEVDRSIVSRSLARLDSLRMIVRRVDPGDRRQVRVRLSTRGKQLMGAYGTSIVAALIDLEPLFAETLDLLGADSRSAAPVGDTTAALVAARLSELGSGLVPRLVENECEYGVTHGTQRFSLYAACAEPGTDAGSISQALKIPRNTVESAIDALTEHGLVSTRRSGSGSIRLIDPTAAGRAMVREHAAILTEDRDGVVTVFTLALSVARHPFPARQ